MHYPKLPPWPFIDPDSPPEGYIKLGESLDRARSNHSPQLWQFFNYKAHLIISIKEWMPGDQSYPGEYAFSQSE